MHTHTHTHTHRGSVCLFDRSLVHSPESVPGNEQSHWRDNSPCGLERWLTEKTTTEDCRFNWFNTQPLLHLHLSLDCQDPWGTTDDFTTSFLHFSLFSTALWDLPNSRPVCSLMLSSHLFLCLPHLLPPFTVPCKMVLARPDEWAT